MPTGALEVGGDLADAVEALEGELERLVGQADASDVHPGLDQVLQRAPRNRRPVRWWR